MRTTRPCGLLACLLCSAAGAAAGGRLSAADCNRNGIEDALDITGGSSGDCNSNGVPDECDLAASRFGFTVVQRESAGPRGADGILTDADADGDLDLLLISATPAEVRLHLNEGGGTFGAAAATPIGEPARSAVLADLDADGDIDAALAGAFGVSFFLKEAEGFEAGGTLPIGSDPVRIAAMDLNGDGLPEIVTANSIGAAAAVNVSVLVNAGNATFRPARNYAAGSNPAAIVPADVDGDGDPDIILVHPEGERASILENDGAGMFPRRFPLELDPASARPHGVVAGSLDGEPAADLVVEYPFQKVEVLFNAAAGSARRSVAIDTGMEAGEGWIGDIDGDGSGDIVLGGKFSSRLWVFLGGGKGVFRQDLPTDFPRPPFAVLPGDLDGDGDLDLALPADGLLWSALQERSGSSGDANSNGIPDECEGVAFVRGDADADAAIGLADAVFILSSLFQGGDEGPCADAADANDDGRIDLTDALRVLLHLFQGGPPPREPFPGCGTDATGDALSCTRFDPCP
jgi:hypothetical protein